MLPLLQISQQMQLLSLDFRLFPRAACILNVKLFVKKWLSRQFYSLIIVTSKEPVCPRVELILKIIIILLIIFLGFIKSKPC